MYKLYYIMKQYKPTNTDPLMNKFMPDFFGITSGILWILHMKIIPTGLIFFINSSLNLIQDFLY